MINKMDAILSLRPKSKWVLRGDDLEWMDTEQTEPTTEEINDEVARLTALEPVNQRIDELKNLLSDTDYVALADYDKEKPELLAQRQAWRDEIRTLQDE
jgi:predicted  nucleic acid-binding Zn-ribbon protein